MYRKKQAQADYRNYQYKVVKRIVRPARRKEDKREAAAYDDRRHCVYLHYLPEPYPEKLKYRIRFFVKRISQQAVVTVHKERLRKA